MKAKLIIENGEIEVILISENRSDTKRLNKLKSSKDRVEIQTKAIYMETTKNVKL